jgi:glutathione S-transferase
MAMQLVGHYDSPFVRRVGVSLHLLGIPFERLPLSVFRHADELRRHNPLGRVPALILDDGEVLIDSAAILDYLDESVGPGRALLPARGKARREALRFIALATGVGDKCVAIAYERRRAADKIDLNWIARCRGQIDVALAALERSYKADSYTALKLMQAEITIAAVLGYVRLREPEAMPVDKCSKLHSLSMAAEASPAFQACRPSVEEIGGQPQEARAALLRLLGNGPTR